MMMTMIYHTLAPHLRQLLLLSHQTTPSSLSSGQDTLPLLTPGTRAISSSSDSEWKPQMMLLLFRP